MSRTASAVLIGSHSRTRRRNTTRISLPPLFGIVPLLTLLCLVYLALQGLNSFFSQKLTVAKRKVSTLEEESQNLRFHFIQLTSSSRIEKFALQQGMIFPEQTEFLMLTPADATSAQAYVPKAKKRLGIVERTKSFLRLFLG